MVIKMTSFATWVDNLNIQYHGSVNWNLPDAFISMPDYVDNDKQTKKKHYTVHKKQKTNKQMKRQTCRKQ
jgi:hypothetical protein